jgi:hypothetical protein
MRGFYLLLYKKAPVPWVVLPRVGDIITASPSYWSFSLVMISLGTCLQVLYEYF